MALALAVLQDEGSSIGPGAFQVAWSWIHHALLLQLATSAGLQVSRSQDTNEEQKSRRGDDRTG